MLAPWRYNEPTFNTETWKFSQRQKIKFKVQNKRLRNTKWNKKRNRFIDNLRIL